MSSVPLGIIRIFPGHWIVGMNFSATSMIGIIAHFGVVVRDAPLIADCIQDDRAHGLPPNVPCERSKENDCVRSR